MLPIPDTKVLIPLTGVYGRPITDKELGELRAAGRVKEINQNIFQEIEVQQKEENDDDDIDILADDDDDLGEEKQLPPKQTYNNRQMTSRRPGTRNSRRNRTSG